MLDPNWRGSANPFCEPGARALVAGLARQTQAFEAISREHIVGIEFKGFSVIGNGPVSVTLFGVGQTAIAVREHIFWIEFDRPI